MTRKTRRLGEFKDILPAKRRNPNSIRRLFFEFVESEFDADCMPAAEALSNAPRRADSARQYQGGFSGEVLYNLTQDDHSATFRQLDAFARYHDVPLSLFLLFTRVYSELDDNVRRSDDRALKVIAAFKQSIMCLEDAIKSTDDEKTTESQFGYARFEEVVDAFHSSFQDGGLPF